MPSTLFILPLSSFSFCCYYQMFLRYTPDNVWVTRTSTDQHKRFGTGLSGEHMHIRPMHYHFSSHLIYLAYPPAHACHTDPSLGSCLYSLESTGTGHSRRVCNEYHDMTCDCVMKIAFRAKPQAT